ncbi:NTP transferase domain-containing protein [Bdellovibrio sp. HCB185ZH]|uniref:NTP transferase domain-containing protein n=1 Tax=Bdellovibrio sp. HCB185ZH TaxID=3394235 RepID=UPI0039A77DE2
MVKKGRSVPPPIKPMRYGILDLNTIQGNATLVNSELESKTLVLLAGGKASRLNSFLNSQGHVKCLTEFSGRLFLDYLLAQANSAGIEHVIILGGPNREVIENSVRKLNYPMRFSFPQEKVRLGTGGALTLTAPYLQEKYFILANADTYFSENPFELVKSQLQEHRDAILFMRTHAAQSSFHEISERITHAWPDLYQTPSYTYTGLSVLSSELVHNWPSLGLPPSCSYEKDVFNKIKIRSKFTAYPFAEIDFGTEAGFKHLEKVFKKEAV